ncbi:20027_t:CDS:2 [Entrophospora sp. SA101]|nr:20027_t:CDS:2 [Entrophospora sp. SA101]
MSSSYHEMIPFDHHHQLQHHHQLHHLRLHHHQLRHQQSLIDPILLSDSSSVNIQKPSSSTNTTTMINDNNNIVNIKSKEKDGSHPIASIDSLMINRSFNSGERCTANNNRSNDREIDDFKKERDNDHRVAEDKINYFSPQNQYEKVKRQLFEENNNTQMLENEFDVTNYYKSKTNELEQKCLQILKSLQQRYDNLPVESNNDNNSNILTAEVTK